LQGELIDVRASMSIEIEELKVKLRDLESVQSKMMHDMYGHKSLKKNPIESQRSVENIEEEYKSSKRLVNQLSVNNDLPHHTYKMTEGFNGTQGRATQ
jgi:archaellum component FlaC